MSENTKIEWADHTFNPWEGCQKVGPGCDHCYAETRNARFSGGTAINWGPGAERRRTSTTNWRKPLQWNVNAEKFAAENGGRRQRVFCASLADVFDNAAPDAWRLDLFQLIASTPNLDWLLLTKRIGNVEKYMQQDHLAFELISDGNVWLGATIVNQTEAERDIPKLMAVPAARRFLSMEPLLGPVDLAAAGAIWSDMNGVIERSYQQPGKRIDWVIVGGESGPGARPMHPDWARSLRDQCAAAGVPFLFKQWGEWVHGDGCDASSGDAMFELVHCGKYQVIGIAGDTHPTDAAIVSQPSICMYRTGKKAAGRLLDGREWNEVPHG